MVTDPMTTYVSAPAPLQPALQATADLRDTPSPVRLRTYAVTQPAAEGATRPGEEAAMTQLDAAPRQPVPASSDIARPISAGMRTITADEARANADARIQRAIAQHYRQAAVGVADESALRRRILFELLDPGVALIDAVLAAEPFYRSDLLRDDDDLRTHLHEQLTRLVFAPIYDLQISANASSVGWAMRMLERRAKRWFKRQGSNLRGDMMDHEHVAHEDRATADQIAEIDELQDTMHTSRGVTKERMGAAAIRKLLYVPALAVPDSRERRDELATAFREDQALPHVALDEYLAATRRAHPNVDLLSAPARLFANWGFEEAARIRSINIKLLGILIRADLSPLPRPSNAKVGDVRWLVRRMCDDGGWVRLAVRLVPAWVDEYCSAVNDWDGRSNFDQAEEDRRIRAQQWPALAAEAAAWPSHPFGKGATVAAIAARLQAMLEEPTG